MRHTDITRRASFVSVLFPGLLLVTAVASNAAAPATPIAARMTEEIQTCGSSSSLSTAWSSSREFKSRAILDGQPTALERIRMAQEQPTAQPAAPAAIDLIAATGHCQKAEAPSDHAMSLTAFTEARPALAISSSSGNFLGSQRLPIVKTRFDADWARVSSSHISANVIRRSMGKPENDPLALIHQVNAWANRTVAYQADSRRSGGDFWASAGQTLRSRTGDCEDIAILKYQALLTLGIPRGDIYFTIARDMVRHADHALLVVRQDNHLYLLDDSTDELVEGDQSNDYRPILTFGEGKWIHALPVIREPVTYLSRNEFSSPRVMGVVR